MTPEAVDLLLVCCEGGRWHVTADNLVDIAVLAKRGLVVLRDDYELIAVHITDKGRRYAIRKSWLEPKPDALVGEPWTRTLAGQQASNFISERG